MRMSPSEGHTCDIKRTSSSRPGKPFKVDSLCKLRMIKFYTPTGFRRRHLPVLYICDARISSLLPLLSFCKQSVITPVLKRVSLHVELCGTRQYKFLVVGCCWPEAESCSSHFFGFCDATAAFASLFELGTTGTC